MKKTKSMYLFCALSLFGLSYLQANTKNTKGTMEIKIEQTLELSTFTKDSSGILYKTIKPGTGTRPYAGETATVHYTGWLLDGKDKVGKKFDSSVDRGQPFQFVIGKGMVISGWDISLAQMKVGEKRIVILPANHGYGAHGAGSVIPPHATLIFEIELLNAA